ncbi:hypothetical protein ES702_01072 [subsurface metagenome]
MDVSPRGLIHNWVPHLPLLLKTIIYAPFGWSPNAEYQDWLTEIIVQSARPILRTPASLLKSQNFFLIDTGIWGHMWVSKYTIPLSVHSHDHDLVGDKFDPNDILTIQQAITFSIDSLAIYDDEKSCPIPPLAPAGIQVEWTGHRRQARPWSRSPSGLSDQGIYQQMLLDLPNGSDSPVILFAHGGAFCLMDPANHRHTAARLANATDSRVLNVRYRLSPQSIFPAALMDIFVAYLSLLSPPPGSFHQAVPGSRIVLAGDSSGGNLVTALQVLLSTLVLNGRTHVRNPWSTNESDSIISIPNPPTAALSLASPWLDITRSLPSCDLNSKYDFIAPPEPLQPTLMSTSPMFPPDEIWPAKPVRTETYCEAVMCTHPLVTPLTTPKQVLAWFPAVYACAGWEGMTDETEVFMRRLAEAQMTTDKSRVGGRTGSIDTLVENSVLESKEHVFDGFLGMPHMFAAFQYNSAGKKASRNRINHIKRALAEAQPGKDQQKSTVDGTTCYASWTNVKTMKETSIPMKDLGMTSEFSGYVRKDPLTDDFLFTKVGEGRVFRVELERRLRENEILEDKKRE